MEASIAPSDPPQGGDPIADYRRYLEENTGDRASGAGPDIPPPDAEAPPPQGAGPEIAPQADAAPDAGQAPDAAPQPADIAPQAGPAGPQPAPQAAPQSAEIAPTPTLDNMMPNPIAQRNAPNAPNVAQAPQAAQAPNAPNAPNAPQAPQAPTVDGKPGAQAPDLGDESKMTPASGHTNGKKTDDGRPMIGIHPPDHSPDDFDTDKLKTANNAADIFDALSKKKQNSYMDWWEQQHGEINQRYDAMRADLGSRPDPNRDPTRKEKFVELLNFGLSLLQNAKPGNSATAAIGASAQEALGTQRARQQQQTSDYDTRVAGIEGQRQNQLKDIGNYGQAVREEALIQNQRVQMARALKPPRPGQPTTRVLNDGTQVDYDPDSGTWNPSVDRNGKPVGKMPIQGPRGGTGSVSATVQNIQALEARGFSPADAVNLTLHVKPSGDPFHDYVSIMNKNTPPGASAEEVETARQVAEETVDHMYGPNALADARARRQKTITGPGGGGGNAPPISMLVEGKVQKFANGQSWTLKNGVPQQVQ